MSKVLIDFETYDKLRELAHEAVDDAIRKVFYTEEGNEERIVAAASTPEDMEQLILFGRMKGFKYKDWNRKEDYTPDFKWEYRYPLAIYGDTKSKTWWVDVHSLSENHPCFYAMMQNLANRMAYVQPKQITGS